MMIVASQAVDLTPYGKPAFARLPTGLGKPAARFPQLHSLDDDEVHFLSHLGLTLYRGTDIEQNPLQILGELSLALGRDVVPGKNLLFLDEIQAGRAVIATLASCGGLLFLKVRNSTPTGKMWTEE